MRQSLGPFLGLRSATAGDVPLNYAGSLRNVRVGDGRILPRYGYRALAGRPNGILSVHGFARLSGYGDDYAHRLEWVSIENRGEGVRPYSLDPATWARTEVTDGGAALSLNGGDWLAFCFNGTSYWINPGGSPSLYRHDVGVPTSWTALQNQAYTPVSPDPSVSADLQQGLNRRPWAADDSVAYSGNCLSGTPTFVVTPAGGLEVHGKDNDDGSVQHSTVTVTFATPVSLDFDYCALTGLGGVVCRDFSRGTKVEAQIGGVWSTPEQHETLSADRKRVAVVFRMKGVANAGAVQAVRLTFYSDPWSNTSGVAWTIDALSLGGTYLGADNATDRPWDAAYRTEGESYGVRYRNVSAGTYTGIKGSSLDASRFGTLGAAPGGPVGDGVTVTANPDTQGPYADDAAGTAFRMEFVRKGLDGKWRVLGDAPNTSGQSWRDRREAWELASLPEAAAGDYVAPAPAPVFTSDAFVSGVSFKGWVVWFQAGGEANVRHSRVGDAEALRSEGDDVADEGRGADFTLADDFADEPLGGVQAGDALLVPGRYGAYGQSGNSPSTMTPFRKLPGSIGCAGRHAFCRFRSEAGSPGMAWLDSSGENVWFADAGALQFSGDVQGRPQELSAPIRGHLRTFLLDEQLAKYPGLAISEVRMDVDEATGSLWIVLGARAAVLRPPSLVDGGRQWETNEYALGIPGTTPVPAHPPPFGAASFADAARGGATLVWQSPNGALPGADVATVGPFTPGLASRWLVGTGFAPAAPIPGDATVTGLTAVVRHRRTSGGVAPTSVVLSAARSGALALAPGRAVPSAFEDFALDLSGLLPLTPAQVNGGIDFRIAYDAAPADPRVYDAANWTVAAAPYDASLTPPTSRYQTTHGAATVATTYAVTATFRPVTVPAGTPAPPTVPIALSSSVGVWTFDLGETQGRYTATLDDGFDPPATTSWPVGLNNGKSGNGKRNAPVVGNVGAVTLATSSTGAMSGQEGGATITAYTQLNSYAVTPPDPSTVEVESVTLVASYTAPVLEGPRRVACLAFGPRDEGLLWLRSSASVDAAEWDPSALAYVQGAGRDGGLAMPEGWWESGRIPGVLRRLGRVETEREGFGPVSLVAFCDRAPGGERATVPGGQRWQRLSTRAQGRTHWLRVAVGEGTGGIRTLGLVYDPLAGPDR